MLQLRPCTMFLYLVPAVAQHSYWIACKLYLKTKDALCKLDGLLVSIQLYIKTHIFRFHHEKQYECREATQDIECCEV